MLLNTQVVILAAGKGVRLEHHTDAIPKALVKVAGKTLIDHQFDFLNHSCIQKVAVVTGYHTSELTPFIKTNHPHVTLFKNKEFDHGSILTLRAALSFLDDDFLMMNVDHIYPQKILEEILKQKQGITAVCDFDRPLVADDMKVKRNARGELDQIHKELKNYDAGYIGMTFCPRSRIQTYIGAFEKTLATLGPKASVEMILGTLAKNGEPIHIANTSGIRWLEVDTVNDLKQAEEALTSHP